MGTTMSQTAPLGRHQMVDLPWLRNPRRGPWITRNIVRCKHPSVDLRRKYKTVLARCAALSLVTVGLFTALLPDLKSGTGTVRIPPVLIKLEDIPETSQSHRLPTLTRPSVPLVVEGTDVPEDVTIDPTELDLEQLVSDAIPLSILSPKGFSTDVPYQEEEIFDYGTVEKKPRLIHQVKPEYPRSALRSGREGTVYVRFVVDRDGKVKDAETLRGPEIFERSALTAVTRFVFEPAVQDGKTVSVRMIVPIEFKINGNG